MFRMLQLVASRVDKYHH